ncbi:hypothetical protein EDD21DRAFT_432625 [Dissophora ornata]|nr:hypothetical protein EDD21DRAFT_432625 [Dissophora ornata]
MKTRSQRQRRIPATTSILFFLTSIVLARYRTAASDVLQHYNNNSGPRYDHDRRDYYLIRVQSPYSQHPHHVPQERHHHDNGVAPWVKDPIPVWELHEYRQQIMGDLLGLRFESRVGMLPDYFLFSSPKAIQGNTSDDNNGDSGTETKKANKKKKHGRENHYKRSLVASDHPQQLSDDEPTPGPEMEEESELESFKSAMADPIVKRFYYLKGQYTGDGSQGQNRGKRQKRHDATMHAEIVMAMGDIQKQELRQRVKKRAPLPEPDSKPFVQKESGDQEEEGAEVEMEGEEVLEGDEDEKQFLEQEEEISPETEEEEESEEEEEAPGDKGGEYQPAGEDQPEDEVSSALGFEDPGFRYQWHLHNTKDRHDINVTGVWEQGINGTGVNVAIIDDGLDMDSEDLAPNFFKEGSWDFNDDTALPKPRLIDDQHGTRCAGEIAASKNDLCGVGVAFGAKVAGLRILSGQITDADEAAALNYRFQDNHVYSCSWGPPDDGRSMDAPKGVVLDAMINGIKNGRSGLGSIYVFATGNGGSQGDDCNFDGYTNSLYTVSIGAIDRAQRHPYYSEACSAQLAVTYSNGGGSAIYTCDVGDRRCFGQHGGTSAAAPIAAGMIALVLSIRPDLSWRDIQYLLMTTAIPVSLDDPDWKTTASGRLFNHKFGYGSLDAYRLVEAAKEFHSLGPQTSLHPHAIHVGHSIPQGGKGVSSMLSIREEDLDAKGVHLGNLEHITVTVNIEHERRGDVEVVLTSPNKVESRLGAQRQFDTATSGFVNWTFMTVKHWDENPVGEWTLTVRDQSNPNYRGKFIDWRIEFWGELRKEIADNSAKPSKKPPAQDEQVLNESPIVHGDTKTKITSTVMEEPSIDSEVVVNDNPSITKESEKEKEDMKGQEKLEKEESGTDGTGKEIESEGTTNPPNASTDDNAKEQNSKQVNAVDSKAESVAEKEKEEEMALTASHTLYAFCGVLGVAGLIVGFITKRKWDGRGLYAGIHGNSPSVSGRFENGDDDIDLLPRGYEGRASESSNGYLHDGSNEELKLGMRDIKSSEAECMNDHGGLVGDGGVELGSDTDEEDFLVAAPGSPIGGRRKSSSKRFSRLAQATSSPATLKVEGM